MSSAATQSLEGPYIAAARHSGGAVAIGSNCGFSIRYPVAVAASVRVPVMASSYSSCLRWCASQNRDLTHDSAHPGQWPSVRPIIVIGGIGAGKFWQDELKRPAPPVNVAAIEKMSSLN